jgi:hypothetical protein
VIDRLAFKDTRPGTASENCNATNSLNMKKESSSIKSIITTLWLILAFVGLSASSLWADTVYTGTGSTATPEPGCTLSSGASTAGGYSGSTNYKSSAPGNPTACTVGGRYNQGGTPGTAPWVRLAPTLAGCGGTYILYGTRGGGFSSDSSDASFDITYGNCTSTTTSTGFFHAGGWTPNDWKAICTITLAPGQTAPTVTFTFHSASIPLDNSHRVAANGFKFDQVVDGTGTADCSSITSPVLDTDVTIHVHGCSPSATAVIIKDTSNGNAVLGETDFGCDSNTPADVDVTVTLTGLGNHILKAVQTIAGVTSRPTTAPQVTVTSTVTAPDLTSITTPVYSDAAAVTVNGVDPTANEVKIYDITASTVIADHTFAAGPSSEAIPVVAGLLVQGHVIKATQFVGGNEGALATAPSAVVSGPICTSIANVGAITSPVYDTAASVTVTGCDPAATTIKVYHGASQIGSAPGGSASVVVTVTPPALVAGWVLSATQIKGGQESCLATAANTTVQPICASVSNVGGFVGPLDGGASTITVSGCSASASLIKVYQGASVVGTAAGGAATVAVACTGLTKGSTLKATQVVGGQESCLTSSPTSATLGSGAPKKVRFCIGLRNTTGASSPLGKDGGGTGNIYFLGASAGQFGQYVGPTGIPAKNIVTADSGWHTLSFDPGDPSWNGSSNVAGSPVGNAGAGGSSWATLEGLYIVPDDSTDTGEYRVYIDNIVNGTQGVLQDFEAATVGTVGVTFSNPSASGTTGGSLLVNGPNSTVVTAAFADTGANSEVVDFQFKDTNAGNWLRLNTLNSAVQKNPSVDITQPITMRVRLFSPTLNVTQVDATHLQFTWSSTWGLVKRGSLTSGTWTAVAGTSPLTVTISPADPPTFFRLQVP